MTSPQHHSARQAAGGVAAEQRTPVARPPVARTIMPSARSAEVEHGGARIREPGTPEQLPPWGRFWSHDSRLELGAVCVLTVGIVATRFQSYLLFHALAETFSIVIGLTVFSIVWNTRRTLDSPFLLVVGLVSGPTALIDLLHTLAFKGMGVFPSTGANLATQLWVAGRVVEVGGIAVAVLLGHRRPRAAVVLASFSALTAVLLGSVFAVKIFPDCFVGTGLTPFKKVAEYVFVTVLLGASAVLLRRRTVAAPTLYPYIGGAVLLMAVQESCFAFYVDVYGILNMAGHVAKIAVFALVYSGVVRFGFTEPQRILFHNLSALNQRLAAGADELRMSRAWLQRVTDNLSEGVLVIDLHGVVRFANPAAVRLLGCDRSGLPDYGGCRIDDHVRVRGLQGEDAFRDSPFWTVVREHGTAQADDLQFVLADGSALEVSCSASIVTDEVSTDVADRQIVLSFRDMRVLNQAKHQLEVLSLTDPLTQVPNRRYFTQELDRQWTRLVRFQRPLAIIMIDIDHFKQFNDNLGHLAGDECIRQVAGALNAVTRQDDLLARYGGEEFAMILPGADLDVGARIAERLRIAVITLGIDHPTDGTVSISLGAAAAVPHPDARAEDLINASDAALYRAKQNGRNRTQLAPSGVDESVI